MHVIFLLFDHLFSQYSNQVSKSLTLMDQILLDVMELNTIVYLIVQVLDQDLILVIVVLTLVIEVVVLIVLICQSQSRLAWKILVVQKVHLLFLKASEVSES